MIKEELFQTFDTQKGTTDHIKFGYIFGSVLSPKRFEKNSDIDIAFFIDPVYYKKDPLLATSLPYLAATQTGIRLNRQTDVIILNTASLETAYQVVTTGLCFFEQDSDNRIEYEVSIKGMYYDFKPFLNKIRSKNKKVKGS